MDRGRSPSASHAHIRHSPSPSPHASFDPSTATGLALDQPQFTSQLNSNSAQPYDLNQTSFDPQSNHFVGIDNSNSSGIFGNTIDPSFLDDQTSNNTFLDPSLLDSNSLMSQMATSQAHSPTPPHLLQPHNNMHRATSISPHHSPNLNQGGFPSPGHSRHASLDPSSAAFPMQNMQNNEWGNMRFGHHRAPSDTFSDVSSNSAHPSPYLGNQDNFDPENNPSPLLGAQQDPALFQDLSSFGHFTLNENRGPSPGHSPHISPSLLPQQHQLPPFTQADNYGLGPNSGIYSSQAQEQFPTLGGTVQDYSGHADQMSPPEINIDFAPPSRQTSFEPPKPAQQHPGDALSPPDRSRSRNRMRAKSDPFSSQSTRASSPGDDQGLSPRSATSRSPSPSTKSSRRSSTSNLPNRDYILDLADPSRPASTGSGTEGGNMKRQQKHPATFQCSLCPKRFTRAYNLRSHLRTHTDERPFVCSVCSKAFARQHDRKRHEGLHSGEKKFVCRGVLKENGTWGCGRRFARADALGRHFRSEAGRVCIRPLLDEEAQERGWQEEQQMQQQNGMMSTMVPPIPGMEMSAGSAFGQYSGPSMDSGMGMPGSSGGYALPAALLAQYPALAGLQWDSLPPGPPDEYEGDISARSSFDASSGGDFYEDEDNGQSYQQQGWASDYETKPLGR
ncbi:hypothetical protein EJ05DRAFT_303264 [Pseudovirgaria hyperparasitica]|uniref:C2H2-type domain-containing protein n=1 Tax=Pseudovirgaria hyperparasitica TaxID=470096 RepID=A0A6A6WCB1_9PEZI|nr:uncharacterized protein EJ05DRAFT_303264 [Pseudovirgaria hyperparasitica]KAF2759600.1 hypothetical protein EJ05DRAFT_303264 [Pseudovirgaria hyperparasitica]